MKKRIISLAIAVMFGCSIYTSAITTYAEEACGETDTVSKGTLLYETEVITQKIMTKDSKLCPFCSNSRLGSKYAHFFQQ